MNNEYNCANDYSKFVENVYNINGYQPANVNTANNGFIFNKHTEQVNDIYESPSQSFYKNNTTNLNVHDNSCNNCQYNNYKMIEEFEGELMESIPIMSNRIQEANKNMNLILETDSALADFKKEEMIKEKQMEDKKYVIKQKVQNEKMESINKKLSDIELLRLRVMTEYEKLKGIQSQVSGKKLAIGKLDNNGHFLIRANNKCLSYNADNNYALEECNVNNDKQKFKMNPINNPLGYKYILNDANVDISNTTYPFYVVHPAEHNTQCLHAGDGEDAIYISVKPCQVTNNQKWDKVIDKINCNYTT
jgi:hypothetical protein